MKDNKPRVCIVVGTRPEIIKMSPLVRVCGVRNIPYYVLHTGQHYSPRMDSIFFEELGLRDADYKIEETCRYETHGEKTAIMIMGVEKILRKDAPDIVLVCGDANTGMVAALAARKMHLVVGHVEAGLRSHDWRMPEEHNRVIIDHISELLFAPTEGAAKNLREDNVRGQIEVTGNTIVDAVLQHIEIAKAKSSILRTFGLEKGNYILLTMHREENVDDREVLGRLLEGVRTVSDRIRKPILFPIHPRTRKRLMEFDLWTKACSIPNLAIVDPVGYLDMLSLVQNSALVMTDSGGLQEESCILHVPCVTLRENTERPETVEVGANLVAGTHPDSIASAAIKACGLKRQWPVPFGDGRAAERIMEAVLRYFGCER